MKLFVLVGLLAVLATCSAGSGSASGSCSCEEEIEADEITHVYIVTAKVHVKLSSSLSLEVCRCFKFQNLVFLPMSALLDRLTLLEKNVNQKKLDKLVEKIYKRDDCEDAEVKSVMNNLMFAATIRMSPDCAEEVIDWGYAVEPNGIQFTEQMPEPWLRNRIDQEDLPLDQKPFVTSGGKGVTVFILDTGVLTDHVEFNGRAEMYRDILAADPNDPEMGDPNGHGTRCAGAAIGSTIGVATEANVKSIRVAGSSGSGSIEQSLLGFEEVKKWTEANPGAKCVVSYSMSSKGISPSLDAAVTVLSEKCVIVISAGNYGQDPETADACLYSPGRREEAITVGAARLRQGGTQDDKAGFSCYGSCVDLYAPGHKVDLASSINADGVIVSSGTSFAAPAVAGAAAVLLGNGYELAEIKDVLIRTASRDKLQGIPAGAGNLLLNVNAPEFLEAKNANF